MPVGSVNYSNNAVSFGKKPHMNDKQKQAAAVAATGLATGAALTAGIVYRKNIGSLVSKLGTKISEMGTKLKTMFKHKTGKLKGLPSPETVSTAKPGTMSGPVEKVKVKTGFKGMMHRFGKSMKKGFNKVVDFFKHLPSKIKNVFKSHKNTLPAVIDKK